MMSPNSSDSVTISLRGFIIPERLKRHQTQLSTSTSRTINHFVTINITQRSRKFTTHCRNKTKIYKSKVILVRNYRRKTAPWGPIIPIASTFSSLKPSMRPPSYIEGEIYIHFENLPNVLGPNIQTLRHVVMRVVCFKPAVKVISSVNGRIRNV